MVQAQPCAEATPSDRERQADQVVRVDEIIRWRAQIELREDTADDIELHTLVGRWAAEANQPEAVGQTDRSDCRLAGWIVQRAEPAAQQAGERSRLLRIRDQGAEDLVLRKEHPPDGLGRMDAAAAARRLERLCMHFQCG